MDSVITEYEILFGEPTRMSLFADDEKSYKTFRQSIIDSPREEYDPSAPLPFEGVVLLKYEYYCLMHYIEKKIAGGKQIYIIDALDGKQKAFGFGYFDSKKNLFYILAHSKINRTDFTKMLLEKEETSFVQKFGGSGEYLATDVGCRSASLAASYVLGEKESYTKWQPFSKQSKSLAETYQYYKSTDIASKEEMSFKLEPSNIRRNKHLFSINKGYTCIVYGYYDETYDLFVILEGGRFERCAISKNITPDMADERRFFITNSCIKDGDFYQVKEDTKVRSASLAAFFVTGAKAKNSIWVDKLGNTLSDIFPEKFGNKTAKKTIVPDNSGQLPLFPDPIHFFINIMQDNNLCYAEAVYDSLSNTFKVLKGASFASKASSTISFSVIDYQRRVFLKNNCIKKKEIYILKEDCSFDSPKVAATYLLATEADGSEWKDKNGKSIIDYNFNV